MRSNKSSNPALGNKIFNSARSEYTSSNAMTVSGTMNKTSILLLLTIAAAMFVWNSFFDNYIPGSLTYKGGNTSMFMIVGSIGGFITAMITSFNPKRSGVLAPIYAIFEGLFLGGISAFFEAKYPGLVMRAVSLTFGVFIGMLFIYRSGAIKVTSKLRRGIVGATLGVGIIYLISWISSFFGVNTSFLFGGGQFGIIFSLAVVGIAAFNLLLDFDFIENASNMGAPKYMEWYGAFSLMVTLVWLYIEILRLLSKLSNRD